MAIFKEGARPNGAWLKGAWQEGAWQEGAWQEGAWPDGLMGVTKGSNCTGRIHFQFARDYIGNIMSISCRFSNEFRYLQILHSRILNVIFKFDAATFKFSSFALRLRKAK